MVEDNFSDHVTIMYSLEDNLWMALSNSICSLQTIHEFINALKRNFLKALANGFFFHAISCCNWCFYYLHPKYKTYGYIYVNNCLSSPESAIFRTKV